MAELNELMETVRSREEGLLSDYEAIARVADTETARRLAESMVKAQRFQLSTLTLMIEDKVPDHFHCFGSVTHDEVRVRRGPNAKEETLRVVSSGTPVIVMLYEGNWVQVQLPDGASGWVFRDYARCELSG